MWSRYIKRLLAAGLLLSCLVPEALAQPVRTPELNMQYHRAEAAWRSGMSVLEAKARIDHVLEALPDDVAALKLRAQVLLSMQRFEEALADARHAAGLAPEDSEAQLILSEAARLSGEPQEAVVALAAAAAHAPADAALHIRLSWNAVALGQLAEAETYARIALALDAAEPATFLQLARVFMMREKQDEAITVLVRGLEAVVLDAAAVQQDTLLSPLLLTPAIREALAN